MTKRIVIVGEAWGAKEAAEGKPFVGPSGWMLDEFLRAVGLSRSECYLTNVFNFQPPGNDLVHLTGPASDRIPGFPPLVRGKFVRQEFAPELNRLYSEIEAVDPNLIIALGGTATWALLRDQRIKKRRGSLDHAITRSKRWAMQPHKLIATYHPVAILRDYTLRPIVFSDFKKAAAEAEFPELHRPKRELWLHPTLSDLAAFETYIAESPTLSVDIETWNYQITCIGFAPSPAKALVIPFIWRGTQDGNYWPTLDDELAAWNYVRRWLNSGKQIIGQNFLYDANYLWRRYGIPIQNITHDTMLVHHAMQPEMEKSLGFLASLYTSEPSWKSMRSDIATLKKED